MKVHKVHITALLITISYYVISNIIFIKAILSPNPIVYFMVPFIFTSAAAITFLYMFSHEKFFAFAREIEKRQLKMEKKLTKRFSHNSKVVTVLAAAVVGGPVLAALTARMLMNDVANKYAVMLLTNIPATIWAVASAKGVTTLFLS